MKKLAEKLTFVNLSLIDGMEEYSRVGGLTLSRGKWVYSHELGELEDTLAELAAVYNASAYALDLQRGRAVIITPAAEAAGVDIDLDLAGYTVVAI